MDVSHCPVWDLELWVHTQCEQSGSEPCSQTGFQAAPRTPQMWRTAQTLISGPAFPIKNRVEPRDRLGPFTNCSAASRRVPPGPTPGLPRLPWGHHRMTWDRPPTFGLCERAELDRRCLGPQPHLSNAEAPTWTCHRAVLGQRAASLHRPRGSPGKEGLLVCAAPTLPGAGEALAGLRTAPQASPVWAGLLASPGDGQVPAGPGWPCCGSVAGAESPGIGIQLGHPGGTDQ